MIDILLVTTALYMQPVDVVKHVLTSEELAMEYVTTDSFDESVIAGIYAPDLVAAYEAVMTRQEELNEPILEGNLITGRQEYCPLGDLVIDAPDMPTEGEAAIHVSFASQWCFTEAPEAIRNEVTELTFRLVEVEEGWLIVDIDHSLYGSLAAYLADLAAE
ncbi:MAG: hypothetical protein KIS96_08675 [Bauldia sp.]|nr:hypothetical protein [Bauldia sp.]